MSLDALSGVRSHVYSPRELEEVVKLERSVRLPVIVETLELYDECLRQASDAHPLDGVSFLVALLAEVGVVPLKKFAFHKLKNGIECEGIVYGLEQPLVWPTCL